MKLPDTNLLVYCVNDRSQFHRQAVRWLESAFNDTAGVGFAWLALIGFVRIATHPKALPTPLSIGSATSLVDEWIAQPRASILHPTQRHGDVLAKFLLLAGTAGNLTNDAHLAALSIEHSCTIGTFDTDFKKFPGIKLDLLS